MIFYKHFIGDYQRDTGHLSVIEHGAYRLLMDACYATEKPLPSDERRLFRLVGATEPVEHEAVRTVLAEFWEETPDGWVNARATKEIAEWEEYTRLQRERGKRGGRPRKEKPSAKPNGLANGKRAPNPDETRTKASHSQLPQSEKNPPPSAPPQGGRGIRLPDDWLPNEKVVAFAREKGLDDERIRYCVEQFCDHWRAASGQKAVKRDWHAAWRTWIRNDKTWNGVGRIGATVAGGRRTQREIKQEFAGAAQEVLTRVRDRAPGGGGKA